MATATSLMYSSASYKNKHQNPECHFIDGTQRQRAPGSNVHAH